MKGAEYLINGICAMVIRAGNLEASDTNGSWYVAAPPLWRPPVAQLRATPLLATMSTIGVYSAAYCCVCRVARPSIVLLRCLWALTRERKIGHSTWRPWRSSDAWGRGSVAPPLPLAGPVVSCSYAWCDPLRRCRGKASWE